MRQASLSHSDPLARKTVRMARRQAPSLSRAAGVVPRRQRSARAALTQGQQFLAQLYREENALPLESDAAAAQSKDAAAQAAKAAANVAKKQKIADDIAAFRAQMGTPLV